MRRALLALALALAGCAAPPETWHRDGATERDFRMEQAQCRVEAAKATGATQSGVDAYIIGTGVYRNCLIGKGWERSRP